MPRGRAGLLLVPPEEVRAATAFHGHDAFDVAMRFGVAERTARRWWRTGLPLIYGKVNVSREQWELYVETGACGRGLLDEPPIAASSGSAKPVRRRTGVDRGSKPVRKSKRLRLSRDLLRDRRRRPARVHSKGAKK